MQHPFQCITILQPASGPQKGKAFLIAACDSKLVSFDIEEGKLVSQYEPAVSVSGNLVYKCYFGLHDEMIDGLTVAGQIDEGNEQSIRTQTSGERPTKRQRVESHNCDRPRFILLAAAPDGCHLVTVSDDKCVRVLRLDHTQNSKFTEVNAWFMPKRPCVIEVLPDSQSVLIADKFGDVYSISMFARHGEALDGTAGKKAEDKTVGSYGQKEAKEGNAPFKPSATELTVHTKRNRKALEAQMKQKQFSKRKEGPDFEHQLLLGHVSMLTDMVHATREAEGRQRSYILTADRDEHIRVSRGPPQSHVIEGYCLGHSEFVSKLCLVPRTDILVSGGGDNWVGVWDWLNFKLRKKVKIESTMIDKSIQEIQQSVNGGSRVNDNVESHTAVSGIWPVPFRNESGETDTAILIALERLPLFLTATLSELESEDDTTLTSFPLKYHPLDVVCVGDNIVVSFDAREDGSPRFQAYTCVKKGSESIGALVWTINESMTDRLKCITEYIGVKSEVEHKKVDDLLYGVANLRKRRVWDTPASSEHAAEAEPGEDEEED